MFSYKSTSIHTLNGDRPLNRIFQKLYYLFNTANNLLANIAVDDELFITDFSCDFKGYWDRLDLKSSPARKLCNLFWLCLPWREIHQELGEIRIFDTGCGNGTYALNLSDWADVNILSYTGVDAVGSENWKIIERKHSSIQFHKCNAAKVFQCIPSGINLFITQSALEHFDEDILYFEQVKNYILSYRESVIQIHLIPSGACLHLYGLHGVRQYTPRTISKIFRLFKDYSYGMIFRLGGSECNQTHYQFITKPIREGIGDLRNSKIIEYNEQLFRAIEKDMSRPGKSPSFYALVIHSNFVKKIF
ncbi:MAG: hypothetical protein ISS45_07295 [Candidatus Omnitrophica bacterium]|nr:hypothetical protein [Candidatus Omnitrophota bacterium]